MAKRHKIRFFIPDNLENLPRYSSYQPDLKTRLLLKCLYPFTASKNSIRGWCVWPFSKYSNNNRNCSHNELDSISGLVDEVEKQIDRSSAATFNRAFCQQSNHQHNNAQETCLFCVITHQNSGRKRNGQLPDEKMASKRIRRKSLLAATGDCQKGECDETTGPVGSGGKVQEKPRKISKSASQGKRNQLKENESCILKIEMSTEVETPKFSENLVTDISIINADF